MPVVQFAPVGLPSPRSADEAPNPLAVVASENLTVASSTRAREARNPAGAQVLVTGSIFCKVTERIRRILTRGTNRASRHLASPDPMTPGLSEVMF